MTTFLSKASNLVVAEPGPSTSIVSPVHYYGDTVHYSPVCGRCPLYFRTVPGTDPETSRRTSHPSARRGPRPRGPARAALIEAGLELAGSVAPDPVVLRDATAVAGVAPTHP